jgi:uncharacterized membrane protein YeaQ/YmgE (transglycosylase-associated protein family)
MAMQLFSVVACSVRDSIVRALARFRSRAGEELGHLSILAWLVIGLIAGWLAATVMKGNGYGIIGDIAAAVAGALLGGVVSSALFGLADALNGSLSITILLTFCTAVLAVAVIRRVNRFVNL